MIKLFWSGGNFESRCNFRIIPPQLGLCTYGSINVNTELVLSSDDFVKDWSHSHQSLCVLHPDLWVCEGHATSFSCGFDLQGRDFLSNPAHLVVTNQKSFSILLGNCHGITLRSCDVTQTGYLGFVRCKIIGNVVGFSKLRFKLAQLSPSLLNLDMMTFKYSFVREPNHSCFW